MKISSSRIRSFIMGGLLFCFALTSCENFMKGQDIRQEIEDTIAYNNAQECTVVFRSDIKYGEFLGSQERSFRVGYDSEVQFELNQDDYVFNGLEALSSDRTASRQDCVKFEKISWDQKKGIYKYRVTLLKDAKDILIQPVCLSLPKVTDISPDSTYLTFSQDTQIKFTFNKALDPASLDKFRYSIYADDDLLEYFNAPLLSEDGKTLFIKPVEGKHIISSEDSRNIQNIYLSYDFSEVLDTDKVLLSAKGNHEYKINRSYSGEQNITVTIPGENAQGRFLSSGEKTCTVGYGLLELSYTLNKEDYKFCGFEAVNNQDNSISYNNSVSFLEKNYDDEKGIYKAKLFINEKTENLLIRPLCLQLPAVTAYSPAQNQLYPSTTQISIQFNMPMEDSIVDAVQISYEGNSMADYFAEPRLSADKETLTIIPKSVELSNFIGSMGNIKVNIRLPETISVTKDQTVLHLKQNQYSSFNITYMAQTENDPPILNNFFLTRDAIDFSTDLSKVNKFHNDIFLRDGDEGHDSSAFNAQEQKIIDNRMGKSINIYGKFTDTGSGIHKISVIEEYKGQAPDTYEGDNEAVTTDYTADSPADIFIINTDSNGATSFCIKYTLKSPDGAVALKLKVYDVCDNYKESPEIFGFKRTSIELENPESYYLSNNLYGLNNNYTEAMLSQKLRTFNLYCNYEDYIYNWFQLPDTIMTISCEYKHSDGSIKSDTFIPTYPNNPFAWDWTLELDVEKISGLSFKITISDDTGNEFTKEYTIPSSEKLTYVQAQEGDETYVQFFYTSGEECYFPCLQAIDKDGNKSIYTGDWSTEKIEIASDYTYIPLPNYKAETNNEDGSVITYFITESPQEMLITKDNNSTASQTLVLENYEGTNYPYKITPSSTIKNISYITVKIPQSTWTNCQNVCLLLKDKGIISPNENFTSYIGNGDIYRFYMPGTTEYSIPVFTSDLYASATQMTLYGICDNKNKYQKDLTIPKLSSTDKPHDNNPPDWTYTVKDSDTYIMTISDNESGPKTAYFIEGQDVYEKCGDDIMAVSLFVFSSQNTLRYTVNNTNDYSVEIPSWFFNDNGFSYYIYDQNNTLNSGSTYGSIYQNWNGAKITPLGSNKLTLSYNIKNQYAYNKNAKYNVYVYTLDTTEKTCWTLFKTSEHTSQANGGSISGGSSMVTITLSNEGEVKQFPETPGFVKIVSALNQQILGDIYLPTNFTAPYYTYLGGSTHDPSGDLILANGTSKSSFAICSMSPVYVHTVVTSKAYDICKDWTVERWENRQKTLGEELINFDQEHPYPKKYNVPVDQIGQGQCYVVIAHFADGHTEMSEIMQK